MNRRQGGLAVCLGLSLMLAAVPARSQVPAQDKVQQGRAEFDAGREALKQGDLQTALAHFRKSLALNRSPGTLLNLASCEEKIGMFASAWRHYDEALGLLPEKDSRSKHARERLQDIKPRIPSIHVQLEAGHAADVVVSFDEKALSAAELGAHVQADPGAHVVTISAPGHVEKRYELMLKAGERQTLIVPPLAPKVEPPAATAAPTVTATATAAPAPSPSLVPGPRLAPSPTGAPLSASAPGGGGTLRIVGLAALGIGGVAAVVGAVTGGLSLGKKQELDSACPGDGPRICDPSLQGTHASGEALAHASTATFIVAGVGLAAGATLLIVSLGKSPAQPPTAHRPPIPAPQLAIGPGSLVVQGRF